MKTASVSRLAGLVLAGAVWLQAGESAPATSSSPEFDRMKTLVGSWQGKVDMGEGPVDMTLQYRLLAGGTVLEERCMVGTPSEMVTMYYEQNGRLALTHYCILGNRPAMLLKSADARTLTFDLDPTCGIDAAKESHMHAMTIRFDDPNTITTSCKAYMDGTITEEKPSQFKRMKP